MSTRSDIAIFTLAHNEKEFLPIWANYYSQFGHTYVIDHDSTDGSADDLPVTAVIRAFNRFCWDHEWIYETCRTVQRRLLGHYKVVVFSTPDEILATEEGTLGDYLERFERQFVYARTGYHVTEMVGEEPLDWREPLLRQRHWWVPDATYGKPLIATRPVFWTAGFHGAADAEDMAETRDPGLFLVHLHRIDRKQAEIRHKRMIDRPLHPSIGEDFEVTLTGERYIRWFYDLIDTYHLPVEAISEKARNLV